MHSYRTEQKAGALEDTKTVSLEHSPHTVVVVVFCLSIT